MRWNRFMGRRSLRGYPELGERRNVLLSREVHPMCTMSYVRCQPTRSRKSRASFIAVREIRPAVPVPAPSLRNRRHGRRSHRR